MIIDDHIWSYIGRFLLGQPYLMNMDLFKWTLGGLCSLCDTKQCFQHFNWIRDSCHWSSSGQFWKWWNLKSYKVNASVFFKFQVYFIASSGKSVKEFMIDCLFTTRYGGVYKLLTRIISKNKNNISNKQTIYKLPKYPTANQELSTWRAF